MPEYLSAEDIATILQHEGDSTISARTVHYYAELKLLPPPDYNGNRPRYTATHLDAMRDLRMQKRQGKRLQEIGAQNQYVQHAIPPPVQYPLPRSTQDDTAPSKAVMLRVAQGLSLYAEGWTNSELTRIVEAMQSVIGEIRQGGSV